MLNVLFSFRGRINRLTYFLSCLGMGAIIAVSAVTVFLWVAAHRAGGPAPVLLLAVFVLTALPLAIWISLALQTKRFRDVGWNPLYVIPAWIVIDVADRLVAHAAPALAMHRQQTLVGSAVNLAMAGCLLFWPGRLDADGGNGPMEAAPPRLNQPPPAPAPRPAAAPWTTTPARASFGRRGL